MEIKKMLPSFSMAIIKTMKGAKSNFQINAINKKPNYQKKMNRISL